MRPINAFLSEILGISVVGPNSSTLIGSSIGSSEGVDLVIKDRILKILGESPSFT